MRGGPALTRVSTPSLWELQRQNSCPRHVFLSARCDVVITLAMKPIKLLWMVAKSVRTALKPWETIVPSTAGPPVVPFLTPFLGEGSSTKINYI